MRANVMSVTAAGVTGVIVLVLAGTIGATAEATTLTGTSRVSTSTAGTQANSFNDFPSVSADGRYVAFVSDATNLDPADTDVLDDIYLKDTVTGTLTYVSKPGAGLPGAKSNSLEPSVSADGQYVVFTSRSGNLVAGDLNGVEDVFRWSRSTGTIDRVSIAQGATPPDSNAVSGKPDVNGDGTVVVFESDATNLEATPDGNPSRDVFRKDMTTGAVTRLSVSTAGFTAGGFHRNPVISDDGDVVAFDSNSPSLVTGDTNSRFDVFVRVVSAGTTSRVSVTSAGAQALNCPQGSNSGSLDPAISGDGDVVAFTSTCTDLVDDDTAGYNDIFVRDLDSGTTVRESVDDGGYTYVELLGDSFAPSLSEDGRFLAFWSNANNVDYTSAGIAGAEAFLRDRAVQVNTALTPGTNSLVPVVNGDGTAIAFSSTGSSVVPGDTNSATDVFVAGNAPDPLDTVTVLPQQRPEITGLMSAIAVEVPAIQFATVNSFAGTYTIPGCGQNIPLPDQPFDYAAAFSGGPYIDRSGIARPAVPRECRVEAITTYQVALLP